MYKTLSEILLSLQLRFNVSLEIVAICYLKIRNFIILPVMFDSYSCHA